MNYEQYYNELAKPFFAPPSNIFGIVWPFLYVGIIVSFGWVFYQVIAKKRWSYKLLIPFALNLVANALYSPLFFNLRLPIFATLDIFVVLITIIGIVYLMWNRLRWVAYAQIPYLLWVSFATVLQVAIILRNYP